MSFKIELDHIGIATPQIEEGNFFQMLGLESLGQEEVASEKVKVGFYNTLNNARIELLESTAPDGPISQFMDKRGPGIHHICFRVQGIDALVAQLKDQGVRLINEEPKMGAHNCRVVFIHPKSTGGVLVELSEKVDG
ncbi:MAG: methylmalonyl-CoA epimerase [Pseudomonadota bacterium]